ncbi:hypothetical protein FOVSG1_002545 [Fusarium oxysporum f. sp. vasinfectum]
MNPDPDLDNRLQYRHVYCARGQILHKYVPITSMDAFIVQPLLQSISHSRTPRDRLPPTAYLHILHGTVAIQVLFDNRINPPFHGLTFLIPWPALQIHQTCQGAGQNFRPLFLTQLT